MQQHQGHHQYTPTDLIEFVRSPFASWMSRSHCDFPGHLQPDPDTPDLVSLAAEGARHEQRVLTQLQADTDDVCSIPATPNRVALTHQAMHAGYAVIYHGALTADDFLGIPDFLVRVEQPSTLGNYSYEVWDAKLARTARPEFVLQLCCYADLLAAVQGRRPEQVTLLLSGGTPTTFRTADYWYYYRHLKAAFLGWMRAFSPNSPPLPEVGGDYGRWATEARKRLLAVDHLSLVATITGNHVRKLQAAGIETLTTLATTTASHVPKLDAGVLQRLKEQAQLQRSSEATGSLAYRLVPPDSAEHRRGLALLPPAGPLDVYFDMEGYPLVEGGLEYLFGAVTQDDSVWRYHDWWAHDADEERRAFADFIDWAYARWRADPRMHVYHYAAYEVTALRKLMGRYGTRESQVDMLLRNEVFVDLYAIVRHGLRAGGPDYSLKTLEHLYRPARAGGVTTAGDSIVFYDRWRASDEPRHWEASPILGAIRDYNRDDCESTSQFVTWLRTQQEQAGIVWVPRPASQEKGENSEEAEVEQSPRQALAEALLSPVPTSHEMAASDGEHHEHWRVQQLLGHVVEFHRREDKPVWWAMFDRQSMSEDELIDDLNCLGGLQRLPGPPERIKQSVGFWYRFDGDQETKLDSGSRCFFAHDLTATEIHRFDRERGRVCLKFGPKKLQQLPNGEPPDRLSLIPDEHVSATVIANSISRTAATWLEQQQLPPALADFLLRRHPKIRGHTGGRLVSPEANLLESVVSLVANLDHSMLCIQGPPGAGKTTVAAHAILALLKTGKRIGVTANSHAAILNVLRTCHELGDGQLTSLKIGGSKEADLFEHYPAARYVDSLRAALPHLSHIPLIGGTAWAFSDPAVRETLDYLLVDEAGQVSVANLIGMAPTARNLVLIGDQMQLGQPIQGFHPGESGGSILEYLLQDNATIPEEMGVFLGTTWRLHPALCAFISATVYDDRLHAAPQTQHRVVKVPPNARRVTKEAGLLFVPVDHLGNTQGSEEEVAVIEELVRELIGREVTDVQGHVRKRLGLEDIVLVAPYNLQVRKLSAALGPQARVGSVDKFQGQEAPVVIISMCSSDGESSPRGLDFVLNKNRLNVALSRAQSLAIVVGSPRLATARCTSLTQMTLLNMFCRLMEEGPPGR
ncbi:MAG: TM0106 family RecB-like putative nuclease [Deltaproteobacteria bacterium]|nr:TM0106 family RecB-like putative nuclease [Deltaproteobacteria bacterium]